jgi:hypothetical protein
MLEVFSSVPLSLPPSLHCVRAGHALESLKEALKNFKMRESEANELLNAFAESGIANADFNRLHQQTPAGLRGSVRLRSAQFVLPRGAVTL